MNNNPKDTIDSKRIALEICRYGAMEAIGTTTLDSINFEAEEDFVAHRLVYRVTMDILSDKLVDDNYIHNYSYEVFSTPWQHFKALYAPGWFKKRYPTRTTTIHDKVKVNFTRYASYPKANVRIRKNQRAYELLGNFEVIQDTVSKIN